MALSRSGPVQTSKSILVQKFSHSILYRHSKLCFISDIIGPHDGFLSLLGFLEKQSSAHCTLKVMRIPPLAANVLVLSFNFSGGEFLSISMAREPSLSAVMATLDWAFLRTPQLPSYAGEVKYLNCKAPKVATLRGKVKISQQ